MDDASNRTSLLPLLLLLLLLLLSLLRVLEAGRLTGPWSAACAAMRSKKDLQPAGRATTRQEPQTNQPYAARMCAPSCLVCKHDHICGSGHPIKLSQPTVLHASKHKPESSASTTHPPTHPPWHMHLLHTQDGEHLNAQVPFVVHRPTITPKPPPPHPTPKPPRTHLYSCVMRYGAAVNSMRTPTAAATLPSRPLRAAAAAFLSRAQSGSRPPRNAAQSSISAAASRHSVPWLSSAVLPQMRM